jgi:hypothetical protein
MRPERVDAPLQQTPAPNFQELLRHGRAKASPGAARRDDGCYVHERDSREVVKRSL